MSNLPLGSEYCKDAPWNETSMPEKEFRVLCMQTLSKISDVSTTDYTCETDVDEDGTPDTFYDTTDTNWNEAYFDEHYSPLGLIEAFRETCKQILEGKEFSDKQLERFKVFIKECEDWIEESLEIYEA